MKLIGFCFFISNSMAAGDKIPGDSTTSMPSTTNTTLLLLHDALEDGVAFIPLTLNLGAEQITWVSRRFLIQPHTEQDSLYFLLLPLLLFTLC